MGSNPQCNRTTNPDKKSVALVCEDDRSTTGSQSASFDEEEDSLNCPSAAECNRTTNLAHKSATIDGKQEDLTTTASKKVAPADGEEASLTPSSDGDRSDGSSSTSSMLTEEEQRRAFFDHLLNALGPRSGIKDPSLETFAACKTIKYSKGFILKSFHVEGAGEFELPLSAEGIPRLLSVCEQAPFEKSLATTVDPSVRRSWQLDASKLSFPRNPTFLSEVVQGMAQNALCALGFDGRGVKVEARLHKLLLHQKDGNFILHRDTEKVKGMFATLILQLPTEEGYTGGTLAVRHQVSDRRFDYKWKEFDCHMVSDLRFCYTVFFADCLHVLREIESGTRLCLTFNLVKRTETDPVYRKSIHDKVQKVQAALQPWLEDSTRLGAKLAIPLRHKYTQENLCFDWLKGDDRILAEVLQNCRDNNNEEWLDLHLCLVTKHIIGTPRKSSGECSYDSDDDSQVAGYSIAETIQFKNWIGLHDTSPSVLLKELGIDLKKEIVDGEKMAPFDSVPNFEGFSGPTVQLWYDTAMLVIWPRLLSITLICEASFSHALDLLENTVESSGPNFCGDLHQVLCFCERNVLHVWGANRDSSKDSITPRLLNLCSRATASEAVQILKLLAKSVPHKPPNSCNGDNKDLAYQIGVRNAEVATAIATSVKVFGWESVFVHIIDLVRQCALTRSESLAQLAKQLISMGEIRAGLKVLNITLTVLGTRIDGLKLHIMPEFSWCQSRAKLPEYPDVEDFLKGPQEKYEKRGCFQDIGAARLFAEDYFSEDRSATGGYSAIATPDGVDSNVFCEIRKTRRVFDVAVEEWRKEQEEIKRLRLEVRKLDSAVPEIDEASMTDVWSDQGDSKRQRVDVVSSLRTLQVMNLAFFNSMLRMVTKGI